ncbi:MAG: hydrogenase expression/formation protein HypE [Leptospiraceae bacterium]|nr:hydrogenase expression/formation protein HypE [Leptospiraceae bacterium]MCP5500302.1 hydrogenase expression/formation protein HypE [Leptospiraceae bacterium]
MKKTINLSHGNGGRASKELLDTIILPCFAKEKEFAFSGDSGIFEFSNLSLAFTTDSFVVSPRFFPGGDIGKLSVCGTLNDLAVVGAKPQVLSCAFIIEEGFSIDELQLILNSIEKEASANGVRIITGDTKVVNRGEADGIYINTSGIGFRNSNLHLSPQNFRNGDRVLVSGTLAEHGFAIFTARNSLNIQANILSDCKSILSMTELLFENTPGIRLMRDPTRGGLATVLNEFVYGTKFSIELEEDKIPLKPEVRGLAEMLGMDPLYMANEGNFVAIVSEEDAKKALDLLHSHPLGENAADIGRITNTYPGKVILHTSMGGKRMLNMLIQDLLPRIC